MRRIAEIAGMILLVVSLGYVAYFTIEHWPDKLSVSWEILFLAATVYAAAHLATTQSWLSILRALRSPISFRDGAPIALVSQVGKYVPGNVAHHLGRATLAKAYGVPLKASAVSTGMEIASAVLAAALVGMTAFNAYPQSNIVVISTIVAIAAAAVGLAFTQFRYALWSIPFLSISIALSGYSFQLLQGNQLAMPAFALAWLLGFLTPGAPGGLGVREATLVAILGPDLEPILVHRILTVVIDGVVAAAAYAFLKTKKSAKDVSSGSARENG